jgi:eukaryotic-like serine/threonine-protein kinase
MPTPQTDRNLLFGVLALQLDFIGRDDLIAALHAWVLDKAKPLGQILREQGKLAAPEEALLDGLVQKHLEKHHNDPQQSLAAVSPLPSLRQDLRQIADPDLQASLMNVPSTPLQPPADATAPYVPSSTLPPHTRFRILRPHARGGLGEVFVAHDEELKREVALKEIQEKHADNPEARSRFLLEAEVTGGLEHPGIVPVYGLGSYGDGRPFYAMRFIRGDSLKDAIARFHQAEKSERDPGRRALELHKLLRRLIDVCNALAYAHSRGVLHRDLKPGNILLGKYGETLVVDWGLAKVVGRAGRSPGAEEPALQPTALSGSQETLPGSAIGTPQYMSPEQAQGRLDQLGPASDVYSLGATLYALLTGKAPVQGSAAGEILKQVARGEFPRPRQVKPDVPPALEAVCLKAMALQPADRYPSPRDLAEDLERWLADEPVSAYREPWTRRLGRWGRRHRAAVAGAAVLLLATVAGLAIGLVAVNAERQRTEQARAAEARRRQQAREALDAMSSEIVEDWLARQKVLTEPQKKFLEKALAFYGEFARDTGRDEASRAGVAQAHFRVANIRRRLGQVRQAEADYHRSRDLYTQLVSDFPAVPAYHRQLAHSRTRLGFLLDDTGRPREAEREYWEALALYERLAADDPGEPGYRRDVETIYHNLGLLLQYAGQAQEAEAEYRRALAIEQRLAADFPDVPEYRQDLARTHNSLGVLLGSSGRRKEAEAEYRAALAVRQKLAADFPADSDYRDGLAASHNSLGLVLRNTGRPGPAEEELRKGLAVRQQLVADFPAVPDYRQGLAQSHLNLGTLLQGTSRPREAEQAYREALAIQQRLATELPAVHLYRWELAGSHHQLATLLQDTRRPKEAEAELAQALAIRQRLATDHADLPDYREGLARSYTGLGILLAPAGRRKEAEADFRSALAVYQQLAADFPARSAYQEGLAQSHGNLGELLLNTGRGDEAEGHFRKALAVQQRLVADHPETPYHHHEIAETLDHFARLEQSRRDYAGARAFLAEAQSHHQAALKGNPRNPTFRVAFRNHTATLAETLLALADHAEAAAAADSLPQTAVDPPEDLYRAGCFLARCVPLAEKDAKLLPSQRQKLATEYAERAVAALRQAVAKGYRDGKHLKEAPDLATVRQREDFQKLLAEFSERGQEGD